MRRLLGRKLPHSGPVFLLPGRVVGQRPGAAAASVQAECGQRGWRPGTTEKPIQVGRWGGRQRGHRVVKPREPDVPDARDANVRASGTFEADCNYIHTPTHTNTVIHTN